MKFVHIALRAAQLLFAVIVMGLSISLAKGQVDGAIPAITIYAIVCGIAGAITALFGIASIFWEDLSGFIALIFDGVSTLILLAGSIAMAAEIGVGSCDGGRPEGYSPDLPSPYCATHPVIAGGGIKGEHDNKLFIQRPNSWFVSRCHMAQADAAFLFFTLGTLFATLFFSFRDSRGGRKGVSVV